MIALRTTRSRHGRNADDSHRICVVIPDCEYKAITGFVNAQRPTVSSVVREMITLGIRKEMLKNERAEG